MNLAYIRVSSAEQNEARQLEALKPYNIDKWFTEKQSGRNTERKELQKLLDFMREGDCVYVKDFSRLSRSVKDLSAVIELCQKKGVNLISLNENFDISTPTGKLMINLIASINQFEREILLERQREGIAIAKQEGKYTGRKARKLPNWDEIYSLWASNQITAVNAAKQLGISRGNFYDRVSREQSGKQE